jgi:formylglycine-generating enzyme
MPMRTIMLLFALSSINTTAIAQTPPPIAVIADKGPHADHVQTLVEQDLQKSGRFTLVERERVEDVLKEISFQQSGVTAQDKAVEIGHHLNVQLLVFLQTHRIAADYQLSLKVVDVGTNQVLRVDTQSLGHTAKDIEIGARLAARRLIARAGLFKAPEMVRIPAGQFSMGAENGFPDERPVHTVQIAPFAMDRYEVSRIAVEEWLVSKGRKKQADLRESDLPATNISWEDAVAFCSERGARLPTEAEWEYAARGSDSRTYPWGTTTPTQSRARFGGGERSPLPVRHLLQGATPEGVHHLAGNVAEWVHDWWSPGYYSASPGQTPQGPEAGDYRSVRGGSWNQPADELRASARTYHNPYKGAGHIGFRCARDTSDPQNN